jgi:hypothetical protein
MKIKFKTIEIFSQPTLTYFSAKPMTAEQCIAVQCNAASSAVQCSAVQFRKQCSAESSAVQQVVLSTEQFSAASSVVQCSAASSEQ